MADPAQLNNLLDTVAKQKTELDDKHEALARAQKLIEDRDRRMQEAYDEIKNKETVEHKLKQHIRLLEE